MTLYKLVHKTPGVNSSSFIAPTASVIGDVSIGDKSSIWFNAVLRGDSDTIRIGNETNIQDLTMCHADPGQPLTVGDRVTVGHRCILHGCTIDDDVLIGMGAIIMNGAKIGSGSIIAAGTVILENTTIPENSLVAGMPGVIKKKFGPEIVEIIQASAAVYVEKSLQYKADKTFEFNPE